jgi:transcription antitermination factor NusB
MTEPTITELLSQRDKRALIFHLLYTAEITDYEHSLAAVARGYQAAFDFEIPKNSDIISIAEWIIQEKEELDRIYQPLLSNWRFDRLGIATKLILRYAVWEMLHTDLETTVIINEAIELAKCFAEKDAYKFINGILDEVAKKRAHDGLAPEKPAVPEE